MTAHVAEVSEGKGRVLLWLDTNSLAARQALEATVRLAAAYNSEIETLDMTPLHAEAHDGVPIRQVMSRTAPANVMGIEETRARTILADGQRRVVNEIAAEFHVPTRHSVHGGDVVDRLAQMCTERGPWNVIALSRVPTTDMAAVIGDLFANVSGATGVLVGSRRPLKWSNRIAVVAEDGERLPSMLRAAERIGGALGSTHLIIAAPTEAAFSELDAQARLLPDGGRITYVPSRPTLAVDGALDGPLVEAAPNLVIARFGGTLLSDGRALSRSLALTGAAFLLVR